MTTATLSPATPAAAPITAAAATAQAATPGYNDATRFLKALFIPDDRIIFRPIETWIEDGEKQSRTIWNDTVYRRLRDFTDDTFQQLLRTSQRNRSNVFFGVCPRYGDKGKYDLQWQIRPVRTLWADVDDVDPEGAIARCLEHGLPRPSIVVASGTLGAHLYWPLATTYRIDDAGGLPPPVQKKWVEIDGKKKPIPYYTDRATGETVYLADPETAKKLPGPELSPKANHIRQILAGIAATIGGDHTIDLSRLLRLPGTMNRKDERNRREPRPCVLLECSDVRHDLEAFERFAEVKPPKSGKATAKQQATRTNGYVPSDQEIIDHIRASKQAAKFDRLFAGDTADYDNDDSRADEALCSIFAYWTRDAGTIERLFGMSELAKREKWTSRADYRNTTISRALELVSEQYDWKRNDRGTVASNDDRTEIEISTDEYETNDAAVSALASSADVYQRSGRLVHVVSDAKLNDGIQRAANTPRIVPIPTPVVRELLTRHARFVVVVGGDEDEEPEKKPTHPPNWCVKAVAERGHWNGIRPLTGIINTPVLRPDGTILNSPGYDPLTGLLFDPQGVTFDIPESPTKADAEQAVEILLDAVCDFPFDKPEHKSAWLSFVLTPLARHAFKGPSPLFLFDANTRGSGKTFAAEIASLIVTGRDFARMSNQKDDDECRKRILSIAMAGDPLVLIDNISGTLGCASLDAALTATVWRDRILGRSEMVEFPLSAVWAASGNNVILGADTSRRIVHVRLNSPLEKPEERSDFKRPHLAEWVKQNRPQLLSAALTILRAFCVAGKPQSSKAIHTCRKTGKQTEGQFKHWGSFEGWSALVRQAVVWCGLFDPGETREELATYADSEASALQQIISMWGSIVPDGSNGVTASEALRSLDEQIETWGKWEFIHRQLRDAVCDLCSAPAGKLPSSRSLGNRLKRFRGRVIDGKSLSCKENNDGVMIWGVETVGTTVPGSAGSPGSPTTQPYAPVCTHAPTHARENTAQPETDPVEPVDPGTPSDWLNHIPLATVSHRDKLEHLNRACQGCRGWKRVTENQLYCIDCRPPKERIAVDWNFHQPQRQELASVVSGPPDEDARETEDDSDELL